MTRVAIVGAGFIGTVHASCLHQIPSVDIAYVFDIDLKKAKAVAKSVDAKVADNLDVILRDKSIDCIIHALPTSHRFDFLKEYVKAEKNIFCEKPLARTLEEGEEILKLLKNYKKQVMIGHVLRFFWEYKTVRDLILNGEIGTPGIVRMSRCCGFPGTASSWYNDFFQSGGVALDLIIHDFDWLIWTFGRIDRISAKGMAPKKISCSDYVLAIAHLKDNVIAHIEGSWVEPPKTFWTAFEISGSGGLIEFDSRNLKPFVFTPRDDPKKKRPGVAIPEIPLLESPYLTQMRHFINCVEKDEKPFIRVDEAFDALKISLAAIESIQSGGEPIKI